MRQDVEWDIGSGEQGNSRVENKGISRRSQDKGNKLHACYKEERKIIARKRVGGGTEEGWRERGMTLAGDRIILYPERRVDWGKRS